MTITGSFINLSIEVNGGMECRNIPGLQLFLYWIIHFTYNVCVVRLCYVL